MHVLIVIGSVPDCQYVHYRPCTVSSKVTLEFWLHYGDLNAECRDNLSLFGALTKLHPIEQTQNDK